MAQWLLSTGLRLWAVLTLGLGDFKVFELWGSSLRVCLGERERERERERAREGGREGGREGEREREREGSSGFRIVGSTCQHLFGVRVQGLHVWGSGPR